MSEKGEVDLTGAKQNTGVWLVKVPKYLSQQWNKATGRGEVGKLRIGKNQGKAEVSFTLNEDLTTIDTIGEKPTTVRAPGASVHHADRGGPDPGRVHRVLLR
ncbi:hypothetical protein ANANG_G00066280 [Anguilla anguilla]|uniref:TFIIF beta subunit N-terminal domain-containing protein n=1 Tax=Anguilla anguilla TaxID=7936 RepID=A0A9D3MU10_ANGAN|nr:hypothetical protein ANANG_G00066280 [Anguilla anguilla]